jgi:hypothetical protein
MLIDLNHIRYLKSKELIHSDNRIHNNICSVFGINQPMKNNLFVYLPTLYQ